MFDRLELLVGKDNLLKLKNSKVVIIGLGGVGGYVFEALVRSNIQNITIIDHDVIESSNINRQIVAYQNNIGSLKVNEYEKRALKINSNVNIIKIPMFLTKENINELFDKADYVIDTCDTINTKKAIIDICLAKNIDFITCLGTGKRMDPSKLKICDIRKTNNDPIAKILRKYIKDMRINKKIVCCWSEEIPKKNSTKTISSNCFVPASAGLLIASYVINKICKN